jgi:hypothetical protein
MAINGSSTKKELVEYLRERHGVDMPEATKDTLLQKAAELDDVDYEEMANPAKPLPTTVAAKELASQSKTKIRIPSTDGSSGVQPVFVSVNGHAYVIQRDVDVDVPESVVEVLRNASTTSYKMIDNQMVPREMLAYPFSVVA